MTRLSTVCEAALVPHSPRRTVRMTSFPLSCGLAMTCIISLSTRIHETKS